MSSTRRREQARGLDDGIRVSRRPRHGRACLIPRPVFHSSFDRPLTSGLRPLWMRNPGWTVTAALGYMSTGSPS